MSKRNSLPTDSDMLKLKKELNFLLWTTDVPQVPLGISMFQATGAPSAPLSVNIQCAAHAVVMAAFFQRRGFRVTTRGGKAVIIDLSPDSNPQNDSLNEIAKHWWLSLDEHGLVDLSLSSETGNPLIYCNRSVDGRWKVAFSENAASLHEFIGKHERGCFYLTLNKKPVTKASCDQSLAQSFTAALSEGIRLTYRRLVEHCESLASGQTETLTDLPQREAWQKLAA